MQIRWDSDSGDNTNCLTQIYNYNRSHLLLFFNAHPILYSCPFTLIAFTLIFFRFCPFPPRESNHFVKRANTQHEKKKSLQPQVKARCSHSYMYKYEMNIFSFHLNAILSLLLAHFVCRMSFFGFIHVSHSLTNTFSNVSLFSIIN